MHRCLRRRLDEREHLFPGPVRLLERALARDEVGEQLVEVEQIVRRGDAAEAGQLGLLGLPVFVGTMQFSSRAVIDRVNADVNRVLKLADIGIPSDVLSKPTCAATSVMLSSVSRSRSASTISRFSASVMTGSTSSTAAAEIEWIPSKPASSGIRVRPCAIDGPSSR